METKVEREESIRIPEPPENLRGRMSLGTAIAFFGPGAIVASLTIGSGETVFATRVGAVFGYAILWTAFITLIAKGALVYASNHYITVTGEHPMARFARIFPGPRGWFPILLLITVVLSFPSFSSGLSIALGTYVQQAGFGNAQVWAVVLILVAAALSYLGGYGPLEKIQIGVVVLLVVLVILAMFVSRPDWLGVLGGLIPNVPEYQPWVAEKYPDLVARPPMVELVTFLGALGGGMYDYVGYTGLLREKRWGLLGHRDIDAIEDRIANLGRGDRIPLSERPEDVRNARQWTLAPLGDTLMSFAALGLFTIAFVVNGVSILGERQRVPEDENILTYQAEFLTAIAPVFRFFYPLAIFLVFFGTIYALWEVYNRTFYESLGSISERVRRAGADRTRPWVYLYVALGGILLVLTGLDIVALVTPSTIIGGTLAGGIYSIGLLYANSRVLPPPYRLGGLARALLIVAAIFLTLAGGIAALEYLGIAPW
ncbi:MAG: Nramp family divalent metal transporter [Actinomycetota bacterium]|nr:Nramp family divalent metal transporter [Actinomycetota bacterium]